MGIQTAQAKGGKMNNLRKTNKKKTKKVTENKLFHLQLFPQAHKGKISIKHSRKIPKLII